MDIMMWRGVPPTGAAGLGTYIGFGGILMILGAIGEWILGNTFPCVVFGSFGSFWIGLGITLEPTSGAVSSYPKGLADPGFNNSWGTYIGIRLSYVGSLTLCRFLLGLHGCTLLYLRNLRPSHQPGPLPDPLPPRSNFLPLDCWLLLHCSCRSIQG
jgi:succinate-acetate transporter protein